MKKKKFDEEVAIEFDEYNRPVGSYANKFKSYIGALVRSHVDINIINWHKVDQNLKNMIWADVKKEFNILDESRKQVVLKAAALRWKDFKSRLLREFVHRKHPKYESPAQCYDFLSEEQWKKFVAERETEQFKEKSQKAKECQSLNEHRHFLGSAGYAGKRAEWIIGDPLSSHSSCVSVSPSLLYDDRSFDWVRARSKKAKDGSYYIPNEKTQDVFQKIVKKCEEFSQGSFQPKRHQDILSAALGKEDYSGSVRGVGSYATIRDVFGKPERRNEKKSGVSVDDLKEFTEKVRQETISIMQPKIDILNNQIMYLMKNMPTKQLFPQSPHDVSGSVGKPQCVHMPFHPPPTRGSCHSVDSYPVNIIQENKGISPQKQNQKMKDHSGECGEQSTADARTPLVSDDVLQHLGDDCRQLVDLLTLLPFGKDYIDLELDHAVFHHTNVGSIFVMLEDIQDLLMMNWLDVSIIQVFILYLHQLCNELGITSIGFVCPSQISKDMVHKNTAGVASYLIYAMNQLKNRRFILAPYHQENHWLLLVICTRSKVVYVLDPMACNRTLEIKVALNMAFRSVPTDVRGVRSVDWKKSKCPQQPGGVECGYYVLRYMYEVCTKYYENESLNEAFQEEPYSSEEVNEIRNMWAKYFMEECI